MIDADVQKSRRSSSSRRLESAETSRTAEAARVAWVSLGIVLLTAWVYAPVRGFDFVNWDDLGYLTENAQVQKGLNAATFFWALTTRHAPYWHPLTWLSHLLDVSLFGMNAGPHHLTNVVIHAASSVLLFVTLRRMTSALGASAFVAAVFAVHPLHVESVAWLAERKDVLSTLFLFAAVSAYVRYVERRGLGRYALVVVFYALALMSKPMVVTLPVVLLLLDVWPLGRPIAAILLVEKLPLTVLALGTGLATFVVQRQVGAVAGLDALPVTVRAGNAVVAYVVYAWKTIWPSPLAAFYPYRPLSFAVVAGSACLLLASTILAIRVSRSRPYVLVGWLWYVVTVAPVIGLLQSGEQAMADRFMYVPMIGLLLAATWTIREHLSVRSSWIAGTLLVVVLAVAARVQVMYWSNSVTLWQHAAAVTERNYIAHENLGQALRERGELDNAAEEYRRALSLAPGRSPAYEAVIHNSLGMVLTRQGKADEARNEFAAAVRQNPVFAEARTNLGNALAAERRFDEAIKHYRVAIRLEPEFTEPRVGLGAALLTQGRAAEAASEYREVLRLDPQLAQAHNGLGGALAMTGQSAEAMREYQEALRLKPDLPTAHLNLAIALAKTGQLAEARRHLEVALSIDPTYEPARQALRSLGPETP